MLVLTRHPNEALVTSGPCTVTVLEIRGTRVKLGVTAEPETIISRAEAPEKTSRNHRAKGSHRQCPST